MICIIIEKLEMSERPYEALTKVNGCNNNNNKNKWNLYQLLIFDASFFKIILDYCT